MKRFVFGLIFGVVLGALGYRYVQKQANAHPEAQQRFEQSAGQLRTNVSQMAENVSDALQARLESLDLTPDKIKDELARTGKIVRNKTKDLGEQVANAASDTRVAAVIKAKYVLDKALSAWDISVGCTQGHVTLSGTVPSDADIGRAVVLALDTEGVTEVTSTLEVKPKE